MQKIAYILFFITGICTAQPPTMELEPNGFDPVVVNIPLTPNEKLIAVSRDWALEFNRSQRGADITNVTENSMAITAYKRNAFYYRNRGFVYEFSITYTMLITFDEDSYTLNFKINDIYSDTDSLIESKIPDYFTPAGNLKEGYEALDESLEVTVNDIVKSHYNFIINFR